MGRIIILLLVLSGSAFAGAPAVEKWWGNTYHQFQQEQQVQTLKKEASRCSRKVDKYNSKVRENPNSDYYKFKLKSWKERCTEDSSVNPYITK